MENVVGKELKWKTTLQCDPLPVRIRYATPALAIGSCFAENIGTRLQDLRYNLEINPFGTLFNPFSIANALDWLLGEEAFAADHLFQHRGLWHSFQHHSLFSMPDRTDTHTHICQRLAAARTHLLHSRWGILTLGTAWVFALTHQPDTIVANCHQLPAAHFSRRRLHVEEIVQRLQLVLQRWKNIQPDLHIILTVSPIRHIKDGLIENQISKATLLVAVHTLCQQLDFVHYFPAYELMVDDLRDYRYYADDLVHPSDAAVQYIAQHFERFALADDEFAMRKELYQFYRACQHRPLHPDSSAHTAFVAQLAQQQADLQTKYPQAKW